MKVAHVCYGCIRVFKEVRALRTVGVDSRVFCLSEVAIPQFFISADYDLIDQERQREDMVQKVKAWKPDLVHVHNEPDWPVMELAQSGFRVVYDVHDMQSLRADIMSDDEKVAFRAADAVVHVGPEVAAKARAVHGYTVPELVLPSYVLERHIDYEPTDRPYGWICYQGGITSKDVIPTLGIPHYRNYLGAVKAFIEAGFEFVIFPARMSMLNGLQPYEGLGAHVQTTLPYNRMLEALRDFGYGLVGSYYPNPLMQAARPNKLWEYLTQGVIPVAWNASSAMQYLAQEGIGLSAEAVLRGEIPDHVAQDMSRRIYRRRREWTMEAHIPELVRLYEEVLDA